MHHGPTVIVTSHHGGRFNIMSAEWSMPLDFDAPKVAVVIDKSTFTRGLVEASGEFVLNIPSRELARLTVDVGNESGADADKFAAHGIATFAGSTVAAPLVEG
jgi:flavin reductase (DIM6/NTAB) family NADH-FMN oxidoreductase RutF